MMNRGNGRQLIFRGAGDYARFLEQLCDALAWDGVVLYAYCLMPTHIHLFVETPAANLDRFMGRLTTAYAMYFRYKHNRPGHCFQGRYKAPLVAGEDYILRLTRYIHLNPVQGDIAENWPVERRWDLARNYRWSSLAGYLAGGADAVPVDYRWLRLVDASGEKQARLAYVKYMQQTLHRTDDVLDEAMKASRYALGDAAFRAEVEDWVRGEAAKWSLQSDLTMPVSTPVSLDRVAAAVAKAFGVGTDALYAARQRVGAARGVFLELACTMGNMRQREVARALGSLSEHAVSKQRRQLRIAMAGDKRLRRIFDELQEALKSKV
ncbi:MAG: transposase [Kiritimatiellia bacterium]